MFESIPTNLVHRLSWHHGAVVAWIVMLSIVFATPALAADLVAVIHKDAQGPVQFAAEEIRREALVRGLSVGGDNAAIRIALTDRKSVV